MAVARTKSDPQTPRGWHHVRVRAALVALLIAGCGDNIGYVSLDEYPVALREALCTYYVRCGQIRDEAACEGLNFGNVAISDRFRFAVAAKHIRWNGEAVYACMQRASEASCDHADPDDWRCEGPLFEGLLHDGELCYWGSECISKECWDGGTGECHESCCAGTCVGDAAPQNGRIGDPCRFSRCLEGRCNGNICVARVPDGGTCMFDDECQVGSWCRLTSSDRHCEPLPDTGESCTGPCRRVGDACAPLSRTCEPYRLLGDNCSIGATCSPFYSCDSVHCTAYELHDGDRCEWDGRRCTDDGSYCAQNLVCTPPSLPAECSEPCVR